MIQDKRASKATQLTTAEGIRGETQNSLRDPSHNRNTLETEHNLVADQVATRERAAEEATKGIARVDTKAIVEAAIKERTEVIKEKAADAAIKERVEAVVEDFLGAGIKATTNSGANPSNLSASLEIRWP